MARPTKLTPQLQAAIVERLEKSAPYEVAAQCEGIHESTFYEWMQKGRAGIKPYAEFAEAVTRARAVAEQEALNDIRTAYTSGENPQPDYRARDRWLQLTNPDRYSPMMQIKTKVESELSDVIEQLRKGLDTPTFDRVLRIILGDEEPGEAGTEPARAGEEDPPTH